MKVGWKYVICFAVGIALSAGVGFIALHGASTKLDAAIDGYRATVVSDWVERKQRIADIEALTRSGIHELAGLRQELSDASAADRRRREAEDARRHGEEERTRGLSDGIRSIIASSGNTTELLRRALVELDRFFGQ